jgi:hypothetical protein
VHFFGLYYRLGGHVYDLIDFTYFGLAFLLVGKFISGRTTTGLPLNYLIFDKAMIFFAIALIISSLSGYYYHEQNPLLTLLAMRYFLYFLIFFCLILLGVSKEYLLKTVVVFAFIYMAIFSIQLVIFPTAIVPLGNIDGFDRGFLRLRIEGVGFITLTAFYALNCFLQSKQKRYIALYSLCFTFIFILGFRTLLATFLLSSFLLTLLHEKTLFKKILSIFYVFVFVFLLLQLDVVQDYLSSMVDKTNEQVGQGNEYIRLLTFDFLFNQVNVNWGSLFFGNGQPFDGTPYGNYVLGFGARDNGFISADLGLIGFVFNYGILSVLAFLNIFRIAIFKKLPKDSVYLNILFFYMVISSITTAEIYRTGMFGVQMIGLYLIVITCNEQRKSVNSTSN